MGKERNKYSVVILCTKNTIENLIENYHFIDLFIKPKNIVVIANKEVENILDQEGLPIIFWDEDKLYPNMTYGAIKESIAKRINDEKALKRTGWYFQQFLKMAFCTVCDSDSYLVWDSDTIPTKEVFMYASKGEKYFDVKTEYNEPYFYTLNHLFPELLKKNNYSFISEHMLFDTDIMKELIEKIESNIEIDGNSFWEKIINAIRVEDIGKSGFSEFETYGTYVEYYHSDKYVIRKWNSLREGTMFYKGNISEKQLRYLSNEYDAISFEKHAIHRKLQKIFAHKCFQNVFMLRLFEKIKSVCVILK